MNNNGKGISISVIVPIYNAEKYLSHSIRSITCQTLKNIEIILVDDGSTDNTSKICKEFAQKDSRIHYFRKANEGSLKARLFGLKQANGDYFMFCDADDYYCKHNAFELLYIKMQDKAYDVIEFGYYRKFRFFNQKKRHKKYEIVEKKEFLSNEYPKLLCSFWDNSKIDISLWNKIYSKELIKNTFELDADLTEKVFMGDDLILNLFLLRSCESILFMPEILYCYRMNSGFTNRWKKQDMFDLNVVKRYQKAFIEGSNSEKKDCYLGTMYCEVPGWFFSHIKSGLKYISEDELKEYINEVLQTPIFISAREYYSTMVNEDWMAANLLREGSADTYIRAAKEDNKKEPVKSKIKKLARKII